MRSECTVPTNNTSPASDFPICSGAEADFIELVCEPRGSVEIEERGPALETKDFRKIVNIVTCRC